MSALEGRRIAITGAGRGIGAATARLLAARGARIAILDLDAEAAERCSRELGPEPSLWRQGSVTDQAAIERFVGAVVNAWGGIDDLVNNAGTWDHAPLLDLTLERWRAVFEVNLFGPIELSRLAVPHMPRGGSIVNVSSVLGQVAAPDRGPYCLSKSALIGLTRLQAIEWAGRGIRVNAIAPGYVMSETTRTFVASGGVDEAGINRRTPLGRFGTEEEVAEGIAFLVDPTRASYVTGHVLEVNGGWTAYGFV